MTCPEKYREICEQFVRQYFATRQRQLENGFVTQIPVDAQAVVLKTPLETPLGHQVVEIAQAAAGELPADKKTHSVIAEGIQDLVEQLFAPPGLTYAYQAPHEFWNEGPFGRMVRDAHLWVRGDELLTLTAAAEITGVSLRHLGAEVQKGTFTLYLNEDEPNPRKNRRVSRVEVEAWLRRRDERAAGLEPDNLVREYNADQETTFKSLADKYEVSANTISSRIERSGIPRRPSRGLFKSGEGK